MANDTTDALAALLQAPANARDTTWLGRLRDVAPSARLSSDSPFVGPDGFSYLALELPAPGAAALTLNELALACTEGGLGAVIGPGAAPAWVFCYGDLWSLRAYGSFIGDPADEPADVPPGPHREVLKEQRRILIGAPSEDYFPTWARRAVDTYLKQLGIAQPRMCLVVDPAQRPSRNLCFNVFVDEPARLPYQQIMDRLRWYLPPRRGLISLNRGVIADESFHPLI